MFEFYPLNIPPATTALTSYRGAPPSKGSEQGGCLRTPIKNLNLYWHLYFRLIAIAIAIIPFLSCQPSSPSPILDEVFYVRHEGADMPAYVHGNAENKTFLLVLHGAGSFGLAFRDGAFTEELEKRYVVVYWDQRGQSMSQGSYGAPEDLIDLMAEDVLALVRVLKHKYGADIKLFLLGHSWGGALGTTVLLKEQQQSQFQGWISVDGAHDFPLAIQSRKKLILNIAEEQIATGQGIAAWQKIQEAVSNLDPEEDYEAILGQARETMKLLVERGLVPTSGSSAKLYRALIDNNPIHWLVGDFFNPPVAVAQEQNYSLTGRLPEIQIPSLLLWGKYDVSVPPVLGFEALQRIGSPDKKLVVFEKSIHHPHDTEPEKFAAEVVDFVEKYR
jgi:pimeloyl-ACP methyl ester carboxylesterase